MESNNIITSQVRRVYRTRNNNNKSRSKSKITRTSQYENFKPFENVNPDAIINVLEDDAIYHVVDDDDTHG